MNRYIIDTSSLIEAHRHTPRDVFPTVWQKLESLAVNGRLVAPAEVWREIKENNDPLTAWSKKHKKMFLDPTDEQINISRKIHKKYPSLSEDDRGYNADIWIVALAAGEASDPQSTLDTNIVVVTQERMRGDKIRIPFVCKEYGVVAVNIMEMFRIEGWTF